MKENLKKPTNLGENFKKGVGDKGNEGENFEHEFLSKKVEVSEFLRKYLENQKSEHNSEHFKIVNKFIEKADSSFQSRKDVDDAKEIYRVIKNINLGEPPAFDAKLLNQQVEYSKKETEETKEGGKLFKAKQELLKKLEELANKHLQESGKQIIYNIASDVITDEVLIKSNLFKDDSAGFIQYYRNKMVEIADKVLQKFKLKEDSFNSINGEKKVIGDALCFDNEDSPHASFSNTLIQWKKDFDNKEEIRFYGSGEEMGKNISDIMMKKIIDLFAEEIEKL